MLPTLRRWMAHFFRRPKATTCLGIEGLEDRDVPASPFTLGNLVVEQVGDGSTILGNASAPVFLNEYKTNGTAVQSIALPTSSSGSNHALTDAGISAAFEGLLTRSPDGGYLTLVGYDTAAGTGSVAATSSSSVARVIGRVSPDGSIDTTTTTTAFSASNIRSAVTSNGTDFWAVGGNTGVVYTTLGASGNGTVVGNTATNLYVVGIFNGQLYVTSPSLGFRGINQVGSGTPTSAGQTTARLPGFGDSTNKADGSFFFADLKPEVPGFDTVYIADETNSSGLMKWTYDGTTWNLTAAVDTGTSALYRGLTGVVNGTSVTLFAVKGASGSQVVTLTDSTGYGGAMADSPTVLVTAASNTAFRSVQFSPVAAPTNFLPSSFSANEDSQAVLGSISVSDVSVASGNVAVTFSVPAGEGSLNVKTDVTDGVTSIQVSGNGSASVTITAPLSRINSTLADLAGFTYTPAADVSGAVTLTMSTSDLGAALTGSSKTDTDTSTITIQSIADDPSVTDTTTNEDTQSTTDLVISRNAADGTEVSHFQITNITNGTLYLNDGTTQINAGEFITYAQAHGDGSTGLKFKPSQDFNGQASFQIQASIGATAAGLGGNKVTAHITINPVNDPPVNVLPGTFNATEDTALYLTGLSTSDVDAGAAVVVVTLAVNSGTLAVNPNVSGGVSAGQISGGGSGAVTLTAPIAAINATLADAAGLTFAPAADSDADVALQMTTDDQGHSGGSAQRDVDGSTIDVAAVPDDPSVTDAATGEDTATSSGLVVTRSAADSTEVGYVKVTNIRNGTLKLQDGTAVSAGDFVPYADAHAGFVFTPTANFFGTGSFDVQAAVSSADAGLGGAVKTAHVTVNPAADTPGVTAATTDEDTPTGDGLVISRNPADGSEVAYFKISNIEHGTLKLQDGTAVSAGDFVGYDDAHAGLVFTPEANFSGTGTFDVQAALGNNDAGLGGGVATAQITVNAVADTPGVTGAATNEDTPTSSGLLVTRNSADGTEVAYVKVTNIQNGTLMLQDGTAVSAGDFVAYADAHAGFVFTPAADFFGTGSFDVQASLTGNDSGLGGDVVTATITVNPVADTASVSGSSTTEDIPTSTGLVIDRNAADAGEVGYFKITNIQHGTLFLHDGQTAVIAGTFVSYADANAGLVFSPEANYFGTGTFDVQASLDNTDAGLGGDVATASIAISPVADDATVTNASTTEDTTTGSGLVIDRSLADGSEVDYFKITNITNGTLYRHDGTTVIHDNDFLAYADANAGLVFKPNDNYFGDGSFQVQASIGNADAGLGGAVATATITIDPVADTPGVSGATTNEDAQTSSGLVVTRNAADGSEASFFKITNITNGTLYLNDGTTQVHDNDFVAYADAHAGFKFTSAANFFGDGGFDLQASLTSDDAGLGGAVVPATITVKPVADTPGVSDATTDEDVQTTGGLVVDRNAAYSSEVAFVKVTNIQNGILKLHDGTAVSAGNFVAYADAHAGFVFTPATNFFGTGTFDVQASLSNSDAGLGGNLVTAGVIVNPVADTPSVTDAATDEDVQTSGGLVISRNAADGNEVAFFKLTNVQHGSLFLNDGSTAVHDGDFITYAQAHAGLKFTPATNFYGTGSFNVQASLAPNDAGLGGGGATARVTVSPVLHAPSVTGSTTAEDNQTASGLVITPNAQDSGMVNYFKVTNIQRGGLFLANGTTAVAEGSFITTAQGAAGLKFTPAANYFGSASFDVQAAVDNTDAGLGEAPGTASITISAVADTPSIDSATTDEDTQSAAGLVVSRNAADGAEVGFFKVTNIHYGTLYLADGTTAVPSGTFLTFAEANAGLKFTPAADYFGTGSFDLQASLSSSDSGLGGSVVTANVTVNPVADTPSVTGAATNEDTQTASGLVVSHNAADGSEVGFFKLTNIRHGTLFLNDGTTAVADGSFLTSAQATAGLKFTPATNYFGAGSFDVQASLSGSDAGLGGSAVTASITVNPVADTPSVTATSTPEDTQSTAGLVITRGAGDGAEVGYFKITNITHGSLFLGDGVTPVTSGSFITAAGGGAGLKFTPAANYHGSASFDVQASLTSDDAGLGGSVVAADITVGSVNDQPILDTSLTPVLPRIPKKGKVPAPGSSIAVLTRGVQDADGDPAGIAIVGVDLPANGVWQYNLDGAADGWKDITAVSAAHALLLSNDADTQIRFLPGARFGGYASLSYRAWDGIDGLVEGTFATDLSATSYSSGQDVAWIPVGAPKFAIDADGNTVLKPVKPNAGGKTTATVMAKDLLGLAGLEAAQATLGIAITVNDPAAGTWEYQLARTKTWVAVGIVDGSNALLLEPTDKLRFTPSANGTGDAALSFLPWDPSSGTHGTRVPATGAGFGPESGTAVLDLVPKLDLSRAAVLNPVNVGQTTDAVAFRSLMSPGNLVNGNVGVAITAAKGSGAWEYLNSAGVWTAVGKVSTGKALFLTQDTEVRFGSADGSKPGTASLSFKAWDLTRVNPGDLAAASGNSVSKETEVLTVAVGNHAPVLDTAPDVHFDVAAKKLAAGVAVKSLLGTAVTDPDGPRSLKGMAVSGIDTAHGTWQYSLGGSKWLDIGAVGDGSALLLTDRMKVRFVADAGYTGPATIRYKAWDQSAGRAGDRVDTTGALDSFSLATETATINVLA